jgi:hypothetical protein
MTLSAWDKRRAYRRPEPREMPMQNWSRHLPRPIILHSTTLKTLADVRNLLSSQFFAQRRHKSMWQFVQHQLVEAAQSGRTVEVFAALRHVLAFEGIHYTAG